jgi:hypothetical protein
MASEAILGAKQWLMNAKCLAKVEVSFPNGRGNMPMRFVDTKK